MNHYKINRALKRTLFASSIMLMGILSLFAQESIKVSGTIVSPENKPVPNVSVSIEGSHESPAFTNEAGAFDVLISKGQQWLIVAPASDYKRKRVYINNRTSILVVVTPIDVKSNEDDIVLLNQTVNMKNVISST